MVFVVGMAASLRPWLQNQLAATGLEGLQIRVDGVQGMGGFGLAKFKSLVEVERLGIRQTVADAGGSSFSPSGAGVRLQAEVSCAGGPMPFPSGPLPPS